MNPLASYFDKFRRNITGIDLEHEFCQGRRKIVYADWAASGRLYRPIESYISNTLGPYVANTHTETTLTGTVMTHAYHQAYDIIKSHVNAADEDVLLFAGFGMTAVINKFQRILGLRVPEKYIERIEPAGDERPLIIITHMEHHSNQTSWEECMCDVKIVRRKSNGLPDLHHLEEILKANASRKLIIGSFTACSNVTGIITPYYQMAEIVHRHGGYCFVDFSASAPYVDIDMHPENPQQKLDALMMLASIMTFDPYRDILAALAKHVDAVAVAVLGPVGEVDLAVLHEDLVLALGHDVDREGLDHVAVHRRHVLERAQLAADAEDRRAADLEVNVGGAELARGHEHSVEDLVHGRLGAAPWSSAPRR